jgi:hypothetical protein
MKLIIASIIFAFSSLAFATGHEIGVCFGSLNADESCSIEEDVGGLWGDIHTDNEIYLTFYRGDTNYWANLKVNSPKWTGQVVIEQFSEREQRYSAEGLICENCNWHRIDFENLGSNDDAGFFYFRLKE